MNPVAGAYKAQHPFNYVCVHVCMSASTQTDGYTHMFVREGEISRRAKCVKIVVIRLMI